MGEYPKSQLHQDAINKAMAPEKDRDAVRAAASEAKMRRELDAAQAVKDQAASKLAILAKTQRLRAARLALLDEEAKKPKRRSPLSMRGKAKA